MSRRAGDNLAFRLAIRKRDWFIYMNPPLGVTLHVDRRLLEMIGEHDPADIMGMLARMWCELIEDRIGCLDPGQQEMHLAGPLDGLTVYFGIRAGKVYVSPDPLFPYW